MTNPLIYVRQGMTVRDRKGDSIGSVALVKMTDEDPETVAVEQTMPDTYSERSDTLIDTIADVFRTDEVPDQLREELLRKGFIRMNADGLFAADRYVLPEQISIVSDDTVILDVDRDALIKRH